MSQTNQQDDHHSANPLTAAWNAAQVTSGTASSASSPTSPLSPPPAPPALAMAAPNISATGPTVPTGTAVTAVTAVTAPNRLYDGYPKWDGDPNSFENWLFTIDIPISDPGMAAFLGSPAHICGALFARIPSGRQSECSAYIRSRQRSRFDEGDVAAPPPFVVDDFIRVLRTAFLPKDLAARAGKQIYCIRQGPAQPLALFLGDYNALCTRAGRYAPNGPARIEIHKAALNDFLRTAAAFRGFRSDFDWDDYSQGLIELATEVEQLVAFRNAKGSKVSVFVDRQTNVPLPTVTEAPRPAAPAPRFDRDGDTVMSGVNALSAATDVGAQIAALASQIAALQGNAPGRRGGGGSRPSADARPHPPAVSMDVRRQRIVAGHCERCDASPSHRWSECGYRNFQSAPTAPGARRALPALFDTGCLPYTAVSDSLVKRHQLPRIPIESRELKLAKDDNHSHPIDSVTYLNLDINGRRERVFGYVIKGLHHDLILGKGWAETNHVVYKAGKRLLRIGTGPTRINVREAGWMDRPAVHERTKHIRDATVVSARVFKALAERAHRRKEAIQLCSASIADINKALDKLAESKQPMTLTEIRAQLPYQISPENAPVFLEDPPGVSLPPHRPGFDMQIPLMKDEKGKELQPPHGPLYDMSHEELLVLRATLTDLLDKGWIRASASPASSPVLFARKPGGGLRFCVDYRGLNAITSKDRYPLPLIRETLRQLAKALHMTKLDVRAAFHRMRMALGEEWKSAFRTRLGSYEWLVCPFGLTGAPAHFQRWINTVLGDALDVFCSAYMDDVIIYTDGDEADHFAKVNLVLSRMLAAGLNIDLSKCAFNVTQVKYLGFIVEAGVGIKVDPEKVDAISAWEEPTNASAVRSFLGFANFYREFAPHFADIAAPLNELTRRGKLWRWDEVHQTAFDRMKEILICAPVLAMYDPDLETVVEADSSGYGLGGVVSQVGHDNLLRPVGFYSRKLTAAEINYQIHDKELLSIISTIKHFRGELRSCRRTFTILSDHRNLQYFMTTRMLSERQIRWAEELSYYNFTIKFRAGKDSEKPDLLSRRDQVMPKDASDERLNERKFQLIRDRWLTPPMVTKETIQGDICAILQISAVRTRAALRASTSTSLAPSPSPATASTNDVDVPLTAPPDAPPPAPAAPPDSDTFTPTLDTLHPARGAAIFEDFEMQTLWDRAVSLDPVYRASHAAVHRGDRSLPDELDHKVQMPDCSFDERGALCYRNAVWVPDHEPLRTALIQRTHDSYITGHPGRDATLAILARGYYWPQQYLTVRQFVRNCAVCNRSKVTRQQGRGLLRPLPVPDRFHSEIAIDFMTELPAENDGDPRFLMVISDRLLHSVTLEAMTTMDAEACARVFVNSHWRFHGFPAALTSDRGSNWTGRFWRRLCQLVGVEQRLSTAFHPQTDGATERWNQEVLAVLRAFISYSQTDWPQLLPCVQLALANRDNARTGMSAFYLTHGYHLDPIQQVHSQASPATKDPQARANAFVSRLYEGQEIAKAAMLTAQQIMENQANRKRRPAEQLRVGDRVWLNLRNVSTPQLKKKLAWTQAKYRVTKVIAPDVYELDVPSSIHNRFFVDILRRDPGDPLPSQVTDDAQPPPMSDGLLPDDEAPMYAVERILRAGPWKGTRGMLVKWAGYKEPSWTHRANLTLTDAFREFVKKYGEGDDVGEAGTGGYTGSTGRKRKGKTSSRITEVLEDDADDPGERG
ncbi:uncharacterized protein CPUR_05440 [Claviceps purpurea 20.1]|uniref:Uncharacterized protein n=1 Tax=Claviceps purpurea (strain 20.1) TaxID=1111077 RepID=M1VWN6_CLAP2|nr:uncharacterized protein CPUR_05440 [Claviceps purpurea 20.1]